MGEARGGAAFLPPRLGLESILAFGPRNVGPNVLFLPPDFAVRILWSGGVDEAGQRGVAEGPASEAEVAMLDAPAKTTSWVRSVAWPNIQSSIAVGFQMATASGEGRREGGESPLLVLRARCNKQGY